jgi:hypothetical protein
MNGPALRCFFMMSEGTTDIGPKTGAAHDSRLAAGSVAAALLPLMALVGVAYLVTGVAMPVLPVYVHQGLGLGTFVVGLVTRYTVRRDAHLTVVGRC